MFSPTSEVDARQRAESLTGQRGRGRELHKPHESALADARTRFTIDKMTIRLRLLLSYNETLNLLFSGVVLKMSSKLFRTSSSFSRNTPISHSPVSNHPS